MMQRIINLKDLNIYEKFSKDVTVVQHDNIRLTANLKDEDNDDIDLQYSYVYVEWTINGKTDLLNRTMAEINGSKIKAELPRAATSETGKLKIQITIEGFSTNYRQVSSFSFVINVEEYILDSANAVVEANSVNEELKRRINDWEERIKTIESNASNGGGSGIDQSVIDGIKKDINDIKVDILNLPNNSKITEIETKITQLQNDKADSFHLHALSDIDSIGDLGNLNASLENAIDIIDAINLVDDKFNTDDSIDPYCIKQDSDHRFVSDTDIAYWNSLKSGSGGSVTVEDSLTSTSTTNALSANQGRVLNEEISNIKSTSTNSYDGKINLEMKVDGEGGDQRIDVLDVSPNNSYGAVYDKANQKVTLNAVNGSAGVEFILENNEAFFDYVYRDISSYFDAIRIVYIKGDKNLKARNAVLTIKQPDGTTTFYSTLYFVDYKINTEDYAQDMSISTFINGNLDYDYDSSATISLYVSFIWDGIESNPVYDLDLSTFEINPASFVNDMEKMVGVSSGLNAIEKQIFNLHAKVKKNMSSPTSPAPPSDSEGNVDLTPITNRLDYLENGLIGIIGEDLDGYTGQYIGVYFALQNTEEGYVNFEWENIVITRSNGSKILSSDLDFANAYMFGVNGEGNDICHRQVQNINMVDENYGWSSLSATSNEHATEANEFQLVHGGLLVFKFKQDEEISKVEYTGYGYSDDGDLWGTALFSVLNWEDTTDDYYDHTSDIGNINWIDHSSDYYESDDDKYISHLIGSIPNAMWDEVKKARVGFNSLDEAMTDFGVNLYESMEKIELIDAATQNLISYVETTIEPTVNKVGEMEQNLVRYIPNDTLFSTKSIIFKLEREINDSVSWDIRFGKIKIKKTDGSYVQPSECSYAMSYGFNLAGTASRDKDFMSCINSTNTVNIYGTPSGARGCYCVILFNDTIEIEEISYWTNQWSNQPLKTIMATYTYDDFKSSGVSDTDAISDFEANKVMVKDEEIIKDISSGYDYKIKDLAGVNLYLWDEISSARGSYDTLLERLEALEQENQTLKERLNILEGN